MEKDARDRLSYYVRLPLAYRDLLAAVRHWSNLKYATDAADVWVKDLDYAQAHSKEIRSLPSKDIYYEKDNWLFFVGSHLRERLVPPLLWTPIDRAIPVELPTLNHNYFGTSEGIAVSLVESSVERETSAVIVSLGDLSYYMEHAPEVRTALLRWCILGTADALVIGKPLLPVPGRSLWSSGDSFLPAGYDFELGILADAINSRLNPGRDKWLIWSADASCVPVPKSMTTTLSRSSFRLSIDLARR